MMSYCRWSTDDFQCDLYCYEDVNGGYTTHVAARRRVLPAELPPEVEPPKDDSHAERMTWAARWMERNERMRPILDAAPPVNIGLPYDGQSFNDPDLESFRERLLHLRETGYQFPASVITVVEEEINERGD